MVLLEASGAEKAVPQQQGRGSRMQKFKLDSGGIAQLV
jgi:hypothetical protein